MVEDDRLKVGSNEMELVDFRLFKLNEDGEVYEGIYGVNVAKVREIIKFPKLTQLPGSPHFIDGIFDLRGVVVPVINLARWMDIKQPENIQSRVVIAEFNNMMIGFTVHEARRIRRISWKDIEPATFTSNSPKFDGTKITGVTKIENDEVLLILDLESIIEELGYYTPTTELDSGDIETFSGTALILDDSPTARKMVKLAVEKMGMHAVEASDGQMGLDKLEELYNLFKDRITDELRIIISDVEMPQMDGFHFASRVKKDPRFSTIPLVFNSSISDHFSDIRGKEAGADAYLTKFNAKSFYNEVASAIKNREDKLEIQE
ncbi:MAG: chemotaxis protein CheV [Sulfurospirillum sp.]|nr:MAG: chemotaxis protein CheV [Sulfurospirillum sp.]